MFPSMVVPIPRMDSHGGVDAPDLIGAKERQWGPNITLQTPLSRRGKGPGLLIVIPDDYKPQDQAVPKKNLDPEPLKKWAEEGFTVVEIKLSMDEMASSKSLKDMLIRSLEELKGLPECESDGKVGVLVYDLNLEISSPHLNQLWCSLWSIPEVAVIVSYSSQPTNKPEQPQLTAGPPTMLHCTSTPHAPIPRAFDMIHVYEAASVNFVLPSHAHYRPGPAGVAHTRSLGFLKKYLGGPIFDLEAIWEEHTLFEFKERDVEKTMATMVEEPYVNHVPTMTGGVGRAALTAFYRGHFIFNNPEDTTLELISRTVGVDRVIDEFIFCFTHTKVIDWLVPGIPPTGQPVRAPFTSVVNVRGDRLYHEHIAWDQASVLRQLGLLPEYLPFPYPLPDGRKPAKGKGFEYRVPTAGFLIASKMVDEGSVESNGMLGFEIREVDNL